MRVDFSSLVGGAALAVMLGVPAHAVVYTSAEGDTNARVEVQRFQGGEQIETLDKANNITDNDFELSHTDVEAGLRDTDDAQEPDVFSIDFMGNMITIANISDAPVDFAFSSDPDEFINGFNFNTLVVGGLPGITAVEVKSFDTVETGTIGPLEPPATEVMTAPTSPNGQFTVDFQGLTLPVDGTVVLSVLMDGGEPPITEDVPLPAGLPLALTGLGMLGYLAHRRRRAG